METYKDRLLEARERAVVNRDVNLVKEIDHALRRMGYHKMDEPETAVNKEPMETATPKRPVGRPRKNG